MTHLHSTVSSPFSKRTLNLASQLLKGFSQIAHLSKPQLDPALGLLFDELPGIHMVRSLLVQECGHQYRCEDRGQVILLEEMLVLNSLFADSRIERFFQLLFDLRLVQIKESNEFCGPFLGSLECL